jgi:hypothetical protein
MSRACAHRCHRLREVKYFTNIRRAAAFECDKCFPGAESTSCGECATDGGDKLNDSEGRDAGDESSINVLDEGE